MEKHKTPWHQATLIAIDLETTGKYPLDAEVCEMAAVKWRGGKVVETFHSLIKPVLRMSAEVIAIHNITNEMVESSPTIQEKISDFNKFISDGYILAHHAPFDMGFLAWEFEKAHLPLPTFPGLCTSLLSRALNADVKNHRLVTLAQHFGVDTGASHRALDDAKACLNVALKYFEKLGPEAKVSDILGIQVIDLPWARFSIESLMEKAHLLTLVRALRDRREVNIVYMGGSRPGQSRKVFPLGLVRQPDGDFLVATEGNKEGDDTHAKRYFLEKITSAQMVPVI